MGLTKRSPHATIDQHLGFPFVWVWICDSANSFLLLGWLVGVYSPFDERNTSITTSHKPRAGGPSIRNPATQNCGILTFVSCTSNLWEQMLDFPKYTRLLPRSISSLPGLQQNRRLGTDPICSVGLYYTHVDINDSQSCDEYGIPMEQNVCQKLVSI